MATVIDYNEVLKDRHSDIFLSQTVLIVIGAVIGVIGNCATIAFYFCRIKERGERYFIPILAIVDLIACLIISTKHVMNNTYLFDFPSNTFCCVTTFLQMFATGLSAHIILIISVQRYLLVCKPFGPKMTIFWKRVLVAGACLFTVLYSCPLLGISGTNTSEDVFLNHTINTTTCRLSTVHSIPTTIYFGLLALIILLNLGITTVLCIPILKKIQIAFPNNKEQNISGQEVLEISLKKTSSIEVLSVIKTPVNSKMTGNSNTHNTVSNQELEYANRNKGPLTYAVQIYSATDNSSTEQEENEESLKESSKSKSSSVKGRIRTMFFVIIFVYVVSYIPTIVCIILRFAIGSFNLITLSRGETFAWFYIARLFFVNHMVNPFIYCYFDVKLKRELKKCCKHESIKKTIIVTANI